MYNVLLENTLILLPSNVFPVHSLAKHAKVLPCVKPVMLMPKDPTENPQENVPVWTIISKPLQELVTIVLMANTWKQVLLPVYPVYILVETVLQLPIV